MNYCGQPFPHVKNPLAVCGMIDANRVYQCPQCAALIGRTCEHGQLGRTCLLCEMRDENLALKARIAELEAENADYVLRMNQWA